ncbi:hypothetical protein DRN86_04865 [Candidatus Geothermarchaeota archaeon]|nr:MAG: hypothetical protein DRN86_04865 [Candidatus Geothermarchaeota archaeon]
MELVIGITGASGAILGIRLLEVLAKNEKVKTHLIISKWGERIIEMETGRRIEDVVRLADHHYDNEDLTAVFSSGSHRFDGMVIIPCSTHTLASIASGFANDLITRTAAVSLKEGRKLVLVIRETPLSSIHIRRMLEVSEAGAVILPPVLTFYHKPKRVGDLIDYVVGKVLDQFNIEHSLFKRWGNRVR